MQDRLKINPDEMGSWDARMLAILHNENVDLTRERDALRAENRALREAANGVRHLAGLGAGVPAA